MIEVNHVQKRFGDLLAVDDLCLKVPTGQALGLLGPNGAGKTTTIRMLVGTLLPDRGSVRMDGQETHRAEIRRKIGMAPQTLALYDELTARENLSFFASLYQLSAAERRDRVDWALDFSQLTGRADSRVAEFSGGMKRRLNLAAALVHDPQVLLLDEPTVGVDPQSRNHIFSCIEKLHAEGRTLIYTTHYMEEVERLCDQVAIIDHGRLLAVDSVDQLIAVHGETSFVQAELAESPPADTELPGTLNGLSWQFRSREPFADVAHSLSSGLRLASLHVSRPNLESVFLNLTGRSLRD